MRKQVLLEQFERRLVELGYPARKMRRKVEELSDHHANLKRTALKSGLSEEDAEVQADVQLGNPVVLADEVAAALRQASWWARHPILGYIILPLVAMFPTFVFSIFLMAIVVAIRMPVQDFGNVLQSPGGLMEFRRLLLELFGIHYLMLTMLAIPFCWMARRSASGLKWATVTCVLCAAQGMFLQLFISRSRLYPAYFWTPNLIGGVGPLLIAAAGYLRQWLMLRNLAPLPDHLRGQPSNAFTLSQLLKTPVGSLGANALSGPVTFDPAAWFKKALRTPTYWIAVCVIVALFTLPILGGVFASKARAKRQAQTSEIKKTTWPAEREAVAQDLQARQATSETFHETTIDLDPYINTKLLDSTDGGPKGSKDNDLRELPRGRNIYGGVPFNVQGRIQLMGHGMEQWKKIYPAKIKDIRINQKCAKIHLFHGESCSWGADVRGATVAMLVLHYTDGSQQEIQIKSGEHLLDWWGIIYKTQADAARRYVKSPDSELAWIGSNPIIKRVQPEMSLRLYKSTFENPSPQLEIESIDYVSTMTYAAPFLVALTVE